MTTREKAADWVAIHTQVKFAVSEAGPNRFLVNVTNRSEGELLGVGLRLWINRPAASITVDAVELGQSLPEVRFDRATESADIDMPALRPGSTLAFHIDLDDPDFDADVALQSD